MLSKMNDDFPEDEEEEIGEEIEKRSCEECCASFAKALKRCLSFLISHIGLMAIVVAYCLLGAVVFERIEKENELMVKDSIQDMRSEVTNDIWAMTNRAQLLMEESWLLEVEERMRKFELELIATMRKKGWNGDESHDKTQWTFTGSLFYSIICITTIGYGDQTPKTPTGKLVTIVYAILGMPLMLFCLSNTGHAMAHSFRFLYWRICCFVCVPAARSPAGRGGGGRQRPGRAGGSRSAAHSRTMSVRSTTSSVVMGTNSNAGVMARRSMKRARRQTAWNTSPESIANFHPASAAEEQLQQTGVIPTILASAYSNDAEEVFANGGGARRDKALASDNGIELICGEPSEGGGVTFGRGEDGSRGSNRSQKSVKSLVALNLPREERTSAGESSSPSSPGNLSIRRQRSAGSFRSNRTMDYDEEFMEYPAAESADYFEDVRKREIPLWICGLLVLGYILGGAVLFARWEKWKFLDSAYFCFVTLTTIGFGDFVPKAEKEVSAELSIAICSVYLLFGMSLLVMTFNLVQQRVVNKARQAAQRLGIIKDDLFQYD